MLAKSQEVSRLVRSSSRAFRFAAPLAWKAGVDHPGQNVSADLPNSGRSLRPKSLLRNDLRDNLYQSLENPKLFRQFMNLKLQ
jgi:hypothetical protein